MTSAIDVKPPHVPDDLFVVGSIHQLAAAGEDPFRGISCLHEGPEILFLTDACRGNPGWVPTRHDILQEIFMNPQLFSSRQNIQVGEMMGVDWALAPLEIDPPQHSLYRRVLQPWFEPKAIDGLDGTIRDACRELMAEFEAEQKCDFVTDFAILFPSHVFLRLMGLPLEQLPQFLEWEHMFTRSFDPAVRVAGARAILNYLEGVVAERRANRGTDLISYIANAQVGNRPVEHGEIMGMCMVLYFGGLDTVVNSIGWYMRHLALDVALQDRLRARPEDIPMAVQEFLRAFGITLTKRTVTRDITFRGVDMKAGDFVALPTCLASRDPRRWADPHAIDIDRKGLHITLGVGVHNCLGAHLAKREVRIVLEEFLSRFTNIRLQEHVPVKWHTEGNFGIDNLPITWD